MDGVCVCVCVYVGVKVCYLVGVLWRLVKHNLVSMERNIVKCMFKQSQFSLVIFFCVLFSNNYCYFIMLVVFWRVDFKNSKLVFAARKNCIPADIQKFNFKLVRRVICCLYLCVPLNHLENKYIAKQVFYDVMCWSVSCGCVFKVLQNVRWW